MAVVGGGTPGSGLPPVVAVAPLRLAPALKLIESPAMPMPVGGWFAPMPAVLALPPAEPPVVAPPPVAAPPEVVPPPGEFAAP